MYVRECTVKIGVLICMLIRAGASCFELERRSATRKGLAGSALRLRRGVSAILFIKRSGSALVATVEC